MSAAFLFSACGLVAIGVGAFGLFANQHLLRRILALNILNSGVFLVLGGLGRRDAEAGADAVPQAIIITGIVVSFAAAALAVNLAVRLLQETGRMELPGEGSSDEPGDA
ncbi:NADH-quinone oxidoreductase subunit K [Methylosinus sp. KRF6]|uniref:NADH-quinone oxidoreductase subunit K n=1 Tax=Methylosinus sp. KRF6 TaxID=2846853 RepID=UPI0035301F3E